MSMRKIQHEVSINMDEQELCDALASFCDKTGLPHMSAGDLVHEPKCTNEQRAWLEKFIEVWDIVIDDVA